MARDYATEIRREQAADAARLAKLGRDANTIPRPFDEDPLPSRRRDVRSSQPEQNRRSAVRYGHAGPPPQVLEFAESKDSSERLKYDVWFSKYHLFHVYCRPGEVDRNPWEAWELGGEGRLVASCTSYEAVTAAARLLNGWCER